MNNNKSEAVLSNDSKVKYVSHIQCEQKYVRLESPVISLKLCRIPAEPIVWSSYYCNVSGADPRRRGLRKDQVSALRRFLKFGSIAEEVATSRTDVNKTAIHLTIVESVEYLVLYLLGGNYLRIARSPMT